MTNSSGLQTGNRVAPVDASVDSSRKCRQVYNNSEADVCLLRVIVFDLVYLIGTYRVVLIKIKNIYTY